MVTMATNMENIMRKARPAINSLLTGTCNVKEYQSVTNATTHVTKQQLVTLYKNQPCRLSYVKNPATAGGDAPGVLLSVKLILPPELEVREGCEIEVTQAGKTETFKAAGAPAMYVNHQEIELERLDKYA